MDENIFFKINNQELIIEQVLVEYNEAPIFFVCKSAEQRFIATCLDLNQEKYLVATIELSALAKMLHAKVSMRNTILLSTNFWEIYAREDVENDVVNRIDKAEIDMAGLPYEDACFSVATKELEHYVERVDAQLYDEGDWEKGSIAVAFI